MDKLDNCNKLERSSDNVKITDHELFKIKLALSSLSNTVVLCPMVADLYTQSPRDDGTWTYFKTGVPGIILNHNIDRVVISVQLCIADPHSGFAIWREGLLNTSDYKATQNSFHTFKMTSQDNCMAGIKFPFHDGANIFLREVLAYIPKISYEPNSSDVPTPILKGLRGSDSTMKKKICKEEISIPCMFTHVTGFTGKSNKDLGPRPLLDNLDAAEDMSETFVIVEKD